ncbi:N,N-dimethylformamidase beta subunit family domain-containing protein, partial [Arthrobacter sp. NPDC058127]|uniref:N,N-dimethylformamidase beta subunit family domain-containing protein n=1 Tax=Arthrobacter sp. NPDC058127 TaxID=3346351 RepID=UPI0036E6F9FA
MSNNRNFPLAVRRAVLPTVLAMIATLLPLQMAVSAVAATDPCAAPVTNPVACENTLPGNPASEWQVSGAGDSTIQGYGTSMSVNIGQTISFKILTPASAYHIDVYRLGYYQGLGARKVASNVLPSAALPQSQPACNTYSDTGLIDCGNWGVSASWAVPSTAVSGVYIARLVRNDTNGASIVPFVVRNDSAHSDMLFQTSDETWQAYNTYGGNSLYSCTVACPPGNPQAYKSAFKVSYNRPFNSAADDQGRSWLMYSEYPMIRFMEANGYDMSYMSGNDVATKGSLLLNHKTFMSVGHDEYWSGDQRANVEAARDAGVNLAFFSGNEVFWKTRWEPSVAGPSTPGRTLVAYKDTHFNAPTDPVSWTGTYRDPRFGTSTGGGNPENSLTGQFFIVNSGTTDITIPSQYSALRMWRNTTIATMAPGTSVTLGAGLGTLGYEWDIDADNGFRPAGLFKLSATTNTSAEVFTDYGSQTATGKTATHNLTMYKAPSGAIVFGAGTVQWPWGLDGFTTGKAVDKNMQQATVNLFADMGVQPATIVTGLTAATRSTDVTPPTSTITSPAFGANIADGTIVTISGTAADTGGVVAGVEVSTDNGNTWRPATGTTNWTFTWNAHGNPTSTLRSRAVDDSGNVETPSSGVVTNVACPCSLSGVNISPTVADAADPTAIEVGAKFYSEVNGTIKGVRFYKATKNTGTHIGNIWSASGQLLASATFTGESATGWQTVNFSTPLAVSANTMYVVSYFAPAGHYSEDTAYFYLHPSPPPAGNSRVDSAPLHYPRSLPGTPNGLYAYGSSSAFPNESYDAEYYWVDAIFNPSSTAPAVSSTTPANNATAVPTNTAPTATFNQAVTASSITYTLKDATNTAVPGTTSYNTTTNTSTFTPTAALANSTTYTATISGATNTAGQTMTAPYSWTFTTTAPPPPPAVTSTTPANNATAVPTNTAPTATFNQAVT